MPTAPTQDCRPGEELDLGRLRAFLSAQDLTPGTLSAVRQFRGGYSNLTYLLAFRQNPATTPHHLVLRRPPFGPRAAKAHDMGREYRALRGFAEASQDNVALRGLAPEAHLYCDDESVIGAPFYLMSYVEGVTLRQPGGPVLAKAKAAQASASLVQALARLHGIEVGGTGLAELGRPEGYVGRQVEGWIGRYERARTPDVSALHELADYLRTEQPADLPGALVHNDYKFDNVVFAPGDYTRVAAVLDWEMATIGNPLMDLGLTLAYWAHAEEVTEMPFLGMNGTHAPGMLRREGLVEAYAKTYETPPVRSLTEMQWYYVFGNVKIAGIVQQIYARYVAGHTRDKRFRDLGKVVDYLLIRARRAL